jgi:hypothetical protein
MLAPSEGSVTHLHCDLKLCWLGLARGSGWTVTFTERMLWWARGMAGSGSECPLSGLVWGARPLPLASE